MRYLLMIYSEEVPMDQVTPEQGKQVMDEYNEFGRGLRERGAILGGEALQNSDTATTIRVRDGRTVTTDGPFIEAKEQFGGYYLFQAKDLDEAIELAALCPGARYGTVEIRPIMEFPDQAVEPVEAGAAGAAGAS